MPIRDDELLTMKTQIDLRSLAASYGDEHDRKNSSRNSTCMRRGDEKVFIGVGRENFWVYWSVHDDDEQGD